MIGLVNIQFAIQRGTLLPVFVIEVNPRASRTVPYVSKATGIPLAKIASRLMVGQKLKQLLARAGRVGQPTSIPELISS